MVEQLTVADLFEEGNTIAWKYLKEKTYPWEILADIKNIITEIGRNLDPEVYDNPSEGVWIAKNAKVFDSAYIGSPCIIGENTEVRHCAFIRGSALVGDNCVIGNSVELKNVLIFNNVQVPHYNYVGDSVLGYKSHMGAGSITSNVKSDKTPVVIKPRRQEFIETGIKKIGAILGDYVEVGCNSVLNPGTVVGRHSNVYPTSCVRGVIPANSIYKSGRGDEIVEKSVE